MFNLFKKPKAESEDTNLAIAKGENTINPMDDLRYIILELVRGDFPRKFISGDFLITQHYSDSIDIKFKEIKIWQWNYWDSDSTNKYKVIHPKAVEYLSKILKLEIEKIRLEAGLISKKKEVEKLIQDLKDKETLIIFS
jgi:hypothetical protein